MTQRQDDLTNIGATGAKKAFVQPRKDLDEVQATDQAALEATHTAGQATLDQEQATGQVSIDTAHASGVALLDQQEAGLARMLTKAATQGSQLTDPGLPPVPPVTPPVVPPVAPPVVPPGVPPPVPSTGALATNRLGVGWATFPIALPSGWARGGLQIGALPTQADIKVRWPDGSIKEAQVTGKIAAAGPYVIAAGPAVAGSWTPTWPTASVTVVDRGVTYAATLPGFASRDPWFDGPYMREDRVIATPVAGTVPHPLLTVVFDIRSFLGGGSRVDVQVRNTKDVTAGAAVTYDVTVNVDGNTVTNKTDVVQAWTTIWRKVFLTGGLVESTVVQDFEPFFAAGAIPRFLSTVANPSPAIPPAAFDMLGFGPMSVDMGSPGGRKEIAPYPDWVAQYVVHPDNLVLKAYILACADLSGSWSGHITEADGETLISLDTYPNYWLDGRSPNHPNGPNATPVPFQGGVFPGGWSPSLETAHIPSLTFVPYLVTGDRYYLDQMKFWANFTLLKTYTGSGVRQGGKGLLLENQPRGLGWALRNLADLVAYLPERDPLRDYFRVRLQNNLDACETYAITTAGGPMEFLFTFNNKPSDILTTSLWQNSYIGIALDRARQHGFGPTAAMLSRIVRTQVRFFSSEADGYPKLQGAPYYPVVAPASHVFYATMKQILDATALFDVSGGAGKPIAFAGYYGPEARMMLQIGVRDGEPGAQAALDYLTPFIAGDLNARSGWALLP